MVVGTKDEILVRIGAALRAHRLEMNLTQAIVAARSGISLTALKHLENGEGATLGTFIQVCRTLNKDAWIVDLEPRETLSPIAYADALKKSAQKKRRRAHV